LLLLYITAYITLYINFILINTHNELKYIEILI